MRLSSAPLALTPVLFQSQRAGEHNRQHGRSARNRSSPMRCDGCVQTLKAPWCYSYRINSCKSLLCKRQRPKTPDWRHVLDRAWECLQMQCPPLPAPVCKRSAPRLALLLCADGGRLAFCQKQPGLSAVPTSLTCLFSAVFWFAPTCGICALPKISCLPSSRRA